MSPGLILALDTSFGPVSAALLAGDGRLLGHRRVAGAAGQQAEVLPPMVGELFSACDATFSALERVVITTGPGAFTGVRVGIAFAKGLRVATGAMLVGVSSLECLAVQAQAAHPGVRTGVVIDARRDEVYVLVRDPDGRHVVAAGLLPVGDAERALLQACDQPMLLFGTGRNLLNLPDVVCPAHDISEIDAVQLGQFGRRVDPVLHPVTPAYLRAPDARLPA